jgi:S1-C subfamily serine protease
MFNRILKLLLTMVLIVSTSLSLADGERGWFGFALSVKGSGMFWNPTLESITIEEVAAGSPTAAAGVVKGDQVIEVEGKPIAGRKAKDVQAQVQSKSPGDKLDVKFKRANGDEYLASLIAAKKP